MLIDQSLDSSICVCDDGCFTPGDEVVQPRDDCLALVAMDDVVGRT